MIVPRPERNVPPIIDELFRLLPAEGSEFGRDQRTNFIAAAEAIFNVIYSPDAKTPTGGKPGQSSGTTLG